MIRTGQIPRLRIAHRRAVNFGPQIREGDLVLILLTRQRFALQAAFDAMGGDDGRNRTETEERKSRLSALMELHEGVKEWLPREMTVRAARAEAGR